MMYKEYLKVASSKTEGEGVFATIEIPAGVPIDEPTGTIHTLQTLPNYPADPNPNVLQIGPNSYLNMSGKLRYINHSCDPNCRFFVLGNRAILYSLYVIPAGAELTFDYSSTSTDTQEMWSMQCKCGSHKCRTTISGFQYLPVSLQEEYKQKGIAAFFITNPIFQKE